MLQFCAGHWTHIANSLFNGKGWKFALNTAYVRVVMAKVMHETHTPFLLQIIM